MANVMDQFSLDGRTALVTGAAGFRKTVPRALGQAVPALWRQWMGSAEQQAQALREEGIPALGLKADITDPHSVETMVSSAVAEFGRLDILVNSAAMDPKFDPENLDAQSANAFETFPLEAWQQAVDVNLTGMFLACQGAARQMVRQNSGVIINICSTYGLVGPTSGCMNVRWTASLNPFIIRSPKPVWLADPLPRPITQASRSG